MSNNRDGDGPPLRREDAKSGAGDDLRAAPFTDQVFDDDYYGRAKQGGSGRSYGLIFGVVLGTLIAVGVGYFAFRGPGGPSIPGGEPPVIKAESTPYKAKPADPGGMQVANQDKLIYERVAKGDAAPQVENLLPAAEEPKEPPPKPVEEVAAPAPQQDSKEQPAMENAEAAGGPEEESPDVDALEQAMAEITSESAKPADSTPKSIESEPNSAESEQQTAALSVPEGAYLVQLAAARSNDGAEGEWKRLSGQHGELLGGLKHIILEADLGERGVFYRLRAGPLSDQAAADDLCAALTAKNAACIVVRP